MGSIVARKTASGSTRYRAQIRIKRAGVDHIETKTFSKETMAKQWMKRREAELEDPATLEAAAFIGVTWAQILERYFAEVNWADFGRSKRMAIKALAEAEFAKKNALTMRASDYLEHVRLRRAGGTGASTVNNDLIWLRLVARHARTAWNIPISLDPINDASMQARASRLTARAAVRDRVPTTAELKLLESSLDAIRPRSKMPMVLIMWLAIYSCRRLSELTRIRRDEIDWSAKVYTVRDVKNPAGSAGNHREAHMTPQCERVLREIIASVPDEDGRVLPFSDRAIGKAWQTVCGLLGIEDLHFHDLRHEGASRLAEDGWTIPQMQSVTLHESWSSLQIYVRMAGRKRERYDFHGEVSMAKVKKNN